MKFLVLQSELGVLRGGGENFTRNLFGVLAKRGHQISAAFVADSLGRFPIPLPSGMTPIPLRGWWSRKPGQATLSSVARYLPAGGRGTTLFERIMDAMEWRGVRWHDWRFSKRIGSDFAKRWQEFDAIYVHCNVGLAAEMARHRPTILRLPGPVSAEMAPLLREIHAVCANGDALIQMRRFMGEEVLELPLGLDGKVFGTSDSSVRGTLGWTKEHVVMGYVGRLNRLKGSDLLADAFKQVAGVYPEARLVVIGSGEEESRVRYTLAKEIADGRVRMVPGLNMDQLASWYRAMDAFILPSRYENFSNALLEAAACGVPFIASDVGGNSIFEKRAVGTLFKPDSAADLARCMGEFIAGREEQLERAMAAAATVREQFSWEVSADHLEEILRARLGLNTVSAPDMTRYPQMATASGKSSGVRDHQGGRNDR